MNAVFKYIYAQPFWRIMLIMAIFIVGWGVFNRKGFDKHRGGILKRINFILFIVAVSAILSTTVIFRTVEIRELCFVPFYSFVLAKEQPEFYRSMLMNICLFVPFGLTMPYILKGDSKSRFKATVRDALIYSIAIEVMQYVFLIGRAEIDDVICNVLGTTVGCLSYLISVALKKAKNAMVERFEEE